VRLCYKSIGNLSLLRTTHEIIWQPDNLKLIIENLKELKEKIETQNLEWIEVFQERYIAAIRTLSNCLLSDETLKTFELKKYEKITQEII